MVTLVKGVEGETESRASGGAYRLRLAVKECTQRCSSAKRLRDSNVLQI